LEPLREKQAGDLGYSLGRRACSVPRGSGLTGSSAQRASQYEAVEGPKSLNLMQDYHVEGLRQVPKLTC
jgi:hypothetical protein